LDRRRSGYKNSVILSRLPGAMQSRSPGASAMAARAQRRKSKYKPASGEVLERINAYKQQ